MNEIAEVEFETNLPLFFDSVPRVPLDGLALILIDALTNATVGAAMIVGPGRWRCGDCLGRRGGSEDLLLILLPGRAEVGCPCAREALVARGDRAVVIDDALIPDSAVPAVVRALELAGVIAVSARTLPQATGAEIEGFGAGGVRVVEGSDEEAIVKSLMVVQ